MSKTNTAQLVKFSQILW